MNYNTDCVNQMMVSYYLIAALATLYVIVLSLDSIKPLRPPKALKALKEYKPWRKLNDLCKQSLNTILDASLLFSISMLLAAIYRFISAIRDPTATTLSSILSQTRSLYLCSRRFHP